MRTDPAPMPESPEDLAALAAGLLGLLCVMAREQAASLGLGKIHFLTREGIIFQRYYDRFAHGAQWPEQSSLLHASRLSTFAASLASEGSRGLVRFFTPYHDANWAELRASLNVPGRFAPPPLAVPTELRGAALARFIATQPPLRAWIDEVARHGHADLAAYMSRYHPGLASEGAAVLVDIGWRGSIQDNLALAMPETTWHGTYFGLLPFLNPQPPNCRKTGVLFPPDAAAHIGANLLPLEFLFDADIGSVTGYRNGEPVHPPHAQPAAGDFVARFQIALEKLAEPMGRMFANATTDGEADTLKATWLHQANAFWAASQEMSAGLFEALREFHHDETFGIASTVRIADTLSWRFLLRSLYDYRARRLLLQYSQSLPTHLWLSPQLGWGTRSWLFLLAAAMRTRDILKGRT